MFQLLLTAESDIEVQGLKGTRAAVVAGDGREARER